MNENHFGIASLQLPAPVRAPERRRVLTSMPFVPPRRAHECVIVAEAPGDDRVCALLRSFAAAPGQVAPPRTLIVAAHPDDETLGPGGMLPRFPHGRLDVLHVTDGAPRHRRGWGRQEFRTWDEYAEARRSEVLRALSLAGVRAERAHRLELMDNETSFDLAGLSYRLMERFAELRPEVVVTHPYEGGHTDHDAVAFATRAAARMLARDGAQAPALAEFTSYHNLGGERVFNRFLPFDRAPETEVELSREERALKRRMFDCFATQQGVLRDMPVRGERFRPAPDYDFLTAPHAGRLRYERYPLGLKGKQWRQLAADALKDLRLPRFY
ncbi:MAG TPA: PIG-L family deacetylase [Longimicrobium sp.]|nr:PIG-L family deacetylase [Longimicrobium sp.]